MHPSGFGDDPQLVPPSLEHWRSDPNLAPTDRETRALGGEPKSWPAIDGQNSLLAPVGEPRLDAHHDCARYCRASGLPGTTIPQEPECTSWNRDV